jgi:hypothetical protein
LREEGLQFKQHPKRRHVGDVGKLALHRKHDTAARAIFLLLVVSDARGRSTASAMGRAFGFVFGVMPSKNAYTT